MTTATMVRRPAPADAPARSGAWLWWLLAAGFVAQVALRLWLNRYHLGPVANPDETGYLLAARWLAGGAGADLSGSTFYQAGYALLLTPIFWLTSDPATAYRLAVVVGAVAVSGAYPMAYLLLRRLRLRPRTALPVAFAAGLSPSLLVFSGYALADAILPVLVLGWLVALHDLAARGSARAGTAAGGVAGGAAGGVAGAVAGAVAGGVAAYAMATHLRGTVIVAVCLLVVAVLFRRLPRATVIATAASAVAGAVAGEALNGALRAALYAGGPRDLSGLLLTRLTSLEGQAWALSGAAGQLWYLIAGTWGLAGVGLAGAAAVLARRSAPLPHRVLAGALLAATLGIAYASSAALPDEHRVGNYAYGRYLACVAVAWTLAGLLVLLRGGRRAVAWHALAAAGLLAVSGGTAAWYAGDRLHRYAFIAFDFPEVIFLSGVRDSLDLVTASLTALVLLACLAGTALLATRRTPALVVGGLGLIHLAFAAHLAPAAPPAPGPDWLPAPGPGRVAVDERVRWNVWVPLAYRVWWTELERFRGTPPPGVCTAIVPPGTPPPPGWAATGHGGDRQGWTSWTGPACRPG
ncbi:hypothetical protein [Nonomuraea candida]|uniref:hypothetical protein n=1 Tax=Nonomuraea candida TaxID=359159 RepID=UPI0012F935E7|nr:hypothetical protein [Nonomuraea candida]